MNWQSALAGLLEKVYEPLLESQTRWLVCGSVATVLQGCHLVPGDIDIMDREQTRRKLQPF